MNRRNTMIARIQPAPKASREQRVRARVDANLPLNVVEAACYAGFTRQAIHQAERRGELARSMGRKFMVEDLQRWLRGQPLGPIQRPAHE